MAPKPQPWFRFYVEAIHDRKLRRLKPEHRWLFVAVLAVARQSPVPGLLMLSDDEAISDDDLADLAALPVRAVTAGMKALEAVGIVRMTDPGCWAVTQWEKRQYESDSSTKRAAKQRAMQQRCNGLSALQDGRYDGQATPPEAETEPETELLASKPTETRDASGHEPPPKVDHRTRAKRAALAIAARDIDRRIETGQQIRDPAAVAKLRAETDIWPTRSGDLIALAEANPDANPDVLADLSTPTDPIADLLGQRPTRPPEQTRPSLSPVADLDIGAHDPTDQRARIAEARAAL